MVNLPKQDPVRAAIATTGVGLVAAALIVGAAVPADATQHTRSVMPSAERHHRPGDAGTSATAQRGQQVFEALFFLQGGDRTRSLLGDAAVSSLTRNEIDSVLRAVSTPESVAKVKQIENELTASNPEYFGDLGATVLSGDPVQVQRYLTSAYDEMLRTPTMTEAVESLKSQETYVPGEVGTDCGIAVVVAVGAVLAVTAVAAVNYALAANIALGFNVAAGANVAYQNNAVKTKSAAATDTGARFTDGVVAAVIEQFGR